MCDEAALTGFFTDFISIKSQDTPDFERFIDISNWYNLILNKSYLCIDISPERLEELVKTDLMFKYLWKTASSGGSKLTINENIISEFSSEKKFGEFLAPVYFLGGDETNHLELRKTYGRAFFSLAEYLNESAIVFEEHKFIVKKGDKPGNRLASWDNIREVMLPLSDIVIIDNYIIKEIEYDFVNILGLLNGLLDTEHVKHAIAVTIITADFKTQPKDIKPAIDKWLTRFNSKLASQLPKVKFKTGMAVLTQIDQNHDRAVITNYSWLNSGNSFSYFSDKGKTKKDTILQVVPLFSSNKKMSESSASAFECWLNLQEHAKNLINNCTYKCGSINENKILQ